MFPEDRILVGVINRKRDFEKVRDEHWYRVPQGRAAKGIYAEYIAFYLSRAFNELNGGIHYYARRTGMELALRRELLPEEANHPRANEPYHKLQLGELRRKDPPILNPSHRPIAFIYTTGDRFSQAKVIADLYSEADYFVDRVFHALEQAGIRPEREWEAARSSSDGGAQIRVRCEEGIVIASTAARKTAARDEHVISLETTGTVQVGVHAILQAIKSYGGPLMVSVPLEG